MIQSRPNPLRLHALFRKYYMLLVILFLFIYLLLSFAAPVLIKMDYSKMGQMLYRLYSNVCHQYIHRSWFLFGQQAYYPGESYNGTLLSAADVFGVNQEDLQAARTIVGHPLAGYKVAICQRDVAIYGSLLMFAVLFYISHNRIKKIKLWLWLLLAVIPIGIDGLWQLFSTPPFRFLGNFTHHSTPLLRSITGVMFGFFSGWYLFPAIEDTFVDEEKGILIKMAKEV